MVHNISELSFVANVKAKQCINPTLVKIERSGT